MLRNNDPLLITSRSTTFHVVHLYLHYDINSVSIFANSWQFRIASEAHWKIVTSWNWILLRGLKTLLKLVQSGSSLLAGVYDITIKCVHHQTCLCLWSCGLSERKEQCKHLSKKTPTKQKETSANSREQEHFVTSTYRMSWTVLLVWTGSGVSDAAGLNNLKVSTL